MSKTPIRQLPVVVFITLILVGVFLFFNYATQIDYYRTVYEIKTNGQYEQAYTEHLKEANDPDQAATQYTLGTIYEDGTFIQQDFKKAYKWYTRSAAQNFEKAIFKIDYFDRHNLAAIGSLAQSNDDDLEDFEVYNENDREKYLDLSEFNKPLASEKTALEKADAAPQNTLKEALHETSVPKPCDGDKKEEQPSSDTADKTEAAASTACLIGDLPPL
ncbi:MAG: hypothetical protein ACTSXQ_06370 [Alphaproteobacteria bacterium]